MTRMHHHLHGGGVSVVLATSLDGTPVMHWGRALGEPLPAMEQLSPAAPRASFDEAVIPGMLPLPSGGWRGRSALRGSRADGTAFSPHLTIVRVSGDSAQCQLELISDDGGLELLVSLALDEHGILAVDHRITNRSEIAYRLDGLDVMLPLPAAAQEQLDFTGRWAKEAQPQRRRIADGTWLRSARHGRTGHDHSFLLAAGTPGFSSEKGEVWAVHLAWSGDHERFIESTPAPARIIGAGELLRAGEVVLAEGESYQTPTLFAAYSDEGLNGIRHRFHRHIRAREVHPAGERPVMLNSWEAVYFEQGLERLTGLVERAAEIGVECFVLDDGWFLGRRDDHRALGDWQVDPKVWGNDLTPLADLVHAAGMRFGLWFEPESVSIDSELARAHPEWVQSPDGERIPLSWRHQQVLDLAAPGVVDHLEERMCALLCSHDIDFVKWDYNRDAVEQGHAGRASSRARTLAFYELLDRLRRAHPEIEFESCASGGARIDLGVLSRTERVWLSDTNDALERQRIQRGYGLLLPPELIGSHVSSPRAHTTGRRHDMSFRVLTALFGHFGVEADITAMGEELGELTAGIELYRRYRGLIHTGDSVEVDTDDPALRVHGVVARDRAEALFAVLALDTLRAERPEEVRLIGLDPDRTYQVTLVPLAADVALQEHPPAWTDAGIRARGDFLAARGLPMPVLLPEHGVLIHVEALE